MSKYNVNIEAVAFDLDGLMFNTEDLWDIVTGTLLRRRDRKPCEEFTRAVTGRPARVALPMLLDWFELDDSVEQLQSEIDLLFNELLPDHLKPMPGLIALLEALDSAGIPKAITTSSHRAFLDELVSLARLETEFTFVLTAESVQEGKPAPEIYLKAASQFGVHPSRMMVLEDSENGCKAATAAGAFAIAVPTHKSAAHCFADVQFVANSLADVRIHEVIRTAT